MPAKIVSFGRPISEEQYNPGKSISKGKQKNTGAGVQFCQTSNKEGCKDAAAKHPGNTIMATPKQKMPSFSK